MFTKDKIKPSNMDQLKDLQKKYLQISHKALCYSRSLCKLENV